ncbi:MAG TPA: phosphate ABC transporter ATP-binding protein PstB [Chloroflexota bacterium]|nr:phosphate ABC transporter ATP-binding protein PstB [Chloroflexota bacterium]
MFLSRSAVSESIEPPVAVDSRPSSSLETRRISAWYGDRQAIRDVSLTCPAGQVTAIIGPSGCGKSTFIRCLNRMHETLPDTRVEGQVLLDGTDIFGEKIDPVLVRRRIGMVFQRPNPFPTMSIFENVAAGLRLNGVSTGKSLPDLVWQALNRVGLWDEVKDKLRLPGTSLSGGQQQRLCIARALAIAPEVLLLDEPTGALDPVATLKIEELLGELKNDYTIVIVTHNMQQAARISDITAFMLADATHIGTLVEVGQTRQIFTNPRDRRTEEYITGRFG